MVTSPIGLHRVVEPPGVLPQAAFRLNADARIADDEARIDVHWLNIDAASFRQLLSHAEGDGAQVKREVLRIIQQRGKLHNPVTGSGGVLVGEVAAVGPECPLDLRPGERIVTLASLTVTPLAVTDGLESWDGLTERAPCAGHAILFSQSRFARIPADLSPELAVSVFDVCAAPALTGRLVRRAHRGAATSPRVAVLGAAGKSGVLACAAAREAGAGSVVGVVRDNTERDLIMAAGVVDTAVVADCRDAVAVAEAVGGPADITVVCVDVPDCEHGAILATASGGTVLFFSMTTRFTSAALGADGLAADVTMLIGNGYVPGQAECALHLIRKYQGVRNLFEKRLAAE